MRRLTLTALITILSVLPVKADDAEDAISNLVLRSIGAKNSCDGTTALAR